MWFKKKQHYIYVFVRKDLPLVQQIVQVGHACFDSGMHFGKSGVHLVLLQVNNEDELIHWSHNLKKHKIKYSMFYEPDYDMGYSALCTEPIHGKNRAFFSDCVLWSNC